MHRGCTKCTNEQVRTDRSVTLRTCVQILYSTDRSVMIINGGTDRSVKIMNGVR